jgi:hypothetical protein
MLHKFSEAVIILRNGGTKVLRRAAFKAVCALDALEVRNNELRLTYEQASLIRECYRILKHDHGMEIIPEELKINFPRAFFDERSQTAGR